MENSYLHDNEERIDQLDHLLFRELGAQQQWRQTFQLWEQRQRQQRRLRLIPFISNVASVAALFIVGLLIKAFVPKLAVGDQVAGVGIEKTDASTPNGVDASDVQSEDSLAATLAQ